HRTQAVEVEHIPLAALRTGRVTHGHAPLERDLAFEEAGVVAPVQLAEDAIVEGARRDGLGMRDESPGYPDTTHLVQAEDAERIGMAARDDCLDVALFGLPALFAHAHLPLDGNAPDVFGVLPDGPVGREEAD